MVFLSNRIINVSPSMTMAISARAAELRASGENIISLSVGEPDFDTPKHIAQAAHDAIQDGITRYTPSDGLPVLKEAIVQKFWRENQLAYKSDEVMVHVGAKQGIYNVCQVLVNPGEEVIIPAPYWVSYPDIVRLAEGVPVIVDCDVMSGLKLTAEKLEQHITKKTKLVFLNSPNNPTGSVYSSEELAELAEVLRRHPSVYLLSDDIYEHMVFGDRSFVSILNVAPDLRDRIIVINGVSKCYAMTGWRIGYCAAHREIISASKKLQSQSTSNANSIAQMAAVAALNGPQQAVKEMVDVFAKRNDVISRKISEIEGLSVKASEGAFYLFVDVLDLMQRQNMSSDLEFSQSLLEHAKIAVVPGTPFGKNGFVRISFAASLEVLEEAIDRLKAYATA